MPMVKDNNNMSLFSKFRVFGIYKRNYFAFAIYLLPFVSLLLFLIDQLTIQKTAMVFWVAFLVGLAPCAIIGLILFIWILISAFKNKSRINKIAGFIGLFLGICGVAAGILGLLFIYAVIN